MTDENRNIDEFAAFIDMFMNPPRDDGASIRKEMFAPEYNAAERNMKAGSFTTTVYKE